MSKPRGQPELIALGGARGVWAELEQARLLFPDADIGAVNEAGADYDGRLTLWATVHPEKLGHWQHTRERNGFNTNYTAISTKQAERVDLVKACLWSGCSGLYLCQVAVMNFGYERIIVCGMPITEDPHYFDGEKWSGVTRYRRGWIEAVQQPELKNKIRSMSGWTRELLGSPHDWLAVPVVRGGAPFSTPGTASP